MTNFTAYLREMAEAFDSKKAFANALGITAPRLSRALSGTDSGYTFNVENCLRLAKVGNRPATEVLRAAGKHEVAELLEHLFPKAGKPSVRGDERQLLDDWALLDEEEQKAFRELIHGRARERRRRHA